MSSCGRWALYNRPGGILPSLCYIIAAFIAPPCSGSRRKCILVIHMFSCRCLPAPHAHTACTSPICQAPFPCHVLQVHTLLKGLEKIAHSADIPMLVAGDFNSSPGSAAHCLLTRGRVEPGMLDQALDPLGILRAPEQKLSHSLPLSSAYSALWDAPPVSDALRRQRTRLDSVHREPLFTHIGRDFKGTLVSIEWHAA